MNSSSGTNCSLSSKEQTSPALLIRAHAAHNTTGLTPPTTQHLVFNWSAHYSGSLSLHHCERARPQHLTRATLPCASGPRLRCSQLLNMWANWSLPASYKHYSRATTEPQLLLTLSHHTLVQAHPESATSTSTPLTIRSVLFRAPNIQKEWLSNREVLTPTNISILYFSF
jgi:hypothetical protein